jgi:hypothetical protein
MQQTTLTTSLHHLKTNLSPHSIHGKYCHVIFLNTSSARAARVRTHRRGAKGKNQGSAGPTKRSHRTDQRFSGSVSINYFSENVNRLKSQGLRVFESELAIQ